MDQQAVANPCDGNYVSVCREQLSALFNDHKLRGTDRHVFYELVMSVDPVTDIMKGTATGFAEAFGLSWSALVRSLKRLADLELVDFEFRKGHEGWIRLLSYGDVVRCGAKMLERRAIANARERPAETNSVRSAPPNVEEPPADEALRQIRGSAPPDPREPIANTRLRIANARERPAETAVAIFSEHSGESAVPMNDVGPAPAVRPTPNGDRPLDGLQTCDDCGGTFDSPQHRMRCREAHF